VSDERRIHPRILLDATVRVWSDAAPKPVMGRVQNISGGGILITTPTRYPAKSVLHVEVMSDVDREAGLIKTLAAKVRVVRVFEVEDGYQLAVRFFEMSLP